MHAAATTLVPPTSGIESTPDSRSFPPLHDDRGFLTFEGYLDHIRFTTGAPCELGATPTAALLAVLEGR